MRQARSLLLYLVMYSLTRSSALKPSGYNRYDIDVITIDSDRYFVLDNDILLNDDGLERFFQDYLQRRIKAQAQALYVKNGFYQRLNQTRFPLVYGIYKKSFGDTSYGYQFLSRAMKKAALDWSKACGVSFHHNPEYDDDSSFLNRKHPPENFYFMIRGISMYKQDAASFFPDTPPADRVLYFNTLLKDTTLMTGILRHEIGHILGFFHDLTGSSSMCNDGSRNGIKAVGDADLFSIMRKHCYIKGKFVGARNLVLTETDEKAARTIYPK
jgi:serralysin